MDLRCCPRKESEQKNTEGRGRRDSSQAFRRRATKMNEKRSREDEEEEEMRSDWRRRRYLRSESKVERRAKER
jgi:hypothetical protein